MADFLPMIAKLEAALARGVSEIESDGERIKFASTTDLLQTLAYFQAKQAEVTAPGYASGGIAEIHTCYDRDWR